MLVGLLPTTALAAGTHSHPVCGMACTHDPVHTASAWEVWDGTSKNNTSGGIQLTEGNWYLTNDVTNDGTAKLIYITGTVNLCLNGHSITNSGYSVINVQNGATLNICDCKGAGSIKYTGSGTSYSAVVNGGTLNIYSGILSGGRGIYNHSGHTVTIYGGSVSATGDGIYNESNCTVNIYGGAVSGGADGVDSGTVNIRGGSVSGTSYGINNAKATISGGAVNATGSDSYGILVGYGGRLELSGNPAITGGAAGVYLNSEAITIGDALTNTTPIVVKMGSNGVFTSGWSTHMSGVQETELSRYFTPADNGYIVAKSSSSGELTLSSVYTVTYDGNEATSGTAPIDDNSPYVSGTKVTVLGNTGNLAKDDCVFLGWSKNADGTGTTYTPDKTFYIYSNTTFYAVWGTPVTGVELDKNAISLTVGENETLTATVSPDNATDKAVSWSSNDANIATVDQDGQVTAVAPGGATITATTADGNFTDTCAVTVSAPPHSHPICGAACTHEDAHSTVDDWTEWTSATSLPTNSGNYYLSVDVHISSTWSPHNGIVLCLNGKTITMNNENTSNIRDVITIGDGVTFTLTDCQSTAGKITHTNVGYGRGVNIAAGIFNMYSGNITGNTNSLQYEVKGGGVYVGSSGIFNLYGGSISENEVRDSSDTSLDRSYGGGVYVDGTFNMSGGHIADNTTTNSGGGVRVNGTFNMTGGSISGNQAWTHGGGVDVDGTFNLVGGSISGNNATYNGGGVYTHYGCTFNMSGGSITGNTANNSAGGVYVYSANTFSVSGAPNINGNTVNESSDNVNVSTSRTITITGALSNATPIGVTVRDSGTGRFAVPSGNVTTLTDGYAGRFTSDNQSYVVLVDGVNLKLAQMVTVIFAPNGGDGTMEAVNVEKDSSYTLPTCNFTAPEGKQFKGWALTLDGEIISAGTITVSADTTLYAIWEDILPTYTVTYTDNVANETIFEDVEKPVVSGEKAPSFGDTYPARTGYIFGGWYTDSTCTTAWDFDAPVTESLTLYAKWTEKATVSISEDVQTYTWDGSNKSFVISGTPNDEIAVQYKVNDNWTNDAPSAVGTYDVKITRDEDTTYKAYEKEITGGLVIQAATPTVTPPSGKTGLVYNGYVQSLINVGESAHGSWEYSLDGTIYSAAVPIGTDAKTYSVYCRFVPKTGYGSIDPIQLSVTISPEPVDEPTVSGEYVYNGTAQTVVLSGFEDSYMTISGGDTGLNANEYEVIITLDSNHTWIATSDGKVQWRIQPAEPKVTWPTGTAYVNDSAVTLIGGSAAGVGTETSIEGSFAIESTVDLSSAGTKTVMISFTPTSANYKGVEKMNYIVTVSKRTVLSAAAQTSIENAVYGTEQADLGLPTTVEITVSGDKEFTVPVAWSGYDKTNLNVQTLTGTLDLSAIDAEVQQADPAITASIVVDLQEKNAAEFTYQDKIATYNGSPISHEISGELEGVASVSYTYKGIGETEYAESVTAPTNVGTYEVTATFTMQTGYAAVASKTAKLTISQKEIGLDWSDFTLAELVYSGTAKIVTATATGLVEGDACTVTVESVGDNVNVGEFSYRATGLNNTNYKLPENVNSPEYTITPKVLTITADSHEVYVGSQFPELTYKVEGLVGADELTTLPVLTTDANIYRAGTYAITFETLASAGDNYAINYVNGTLTVKNYPYIPQPAYDVEIANDIIGGEVSASKNRAYKGDTVTLTITPDAGYELTELTVTDSRGNVVDLTKVSDSKYTFKMPGYDVEVDAEFAKIETSCPRDWTCPMYGYTDLNRTLWYHDGIHFCIENDLMVGTGTNIFEPNTTLTRAMLVTILWRLEGSPVVNYAMDFEDVESDKWYTEAIRWAASEKIVEGYGNGKFGTSDAITREQLATILYRYEQSKGGGFTGLWSYRMDFVDLADVSDWAYEAMCWMNMNEVVTGKPGKLLDPKGSATRAEAAAMIQRYSDVMTEED